MTEEEARDWIVAQQISSKTISQIESFIVFLLAEADKQNLISTASRDHIWARHIVDSAQLIDAAQQAEAGPWLDLGTGAGFPGLIVAMLVDRPVVLVESRRKRVEFLTTARDMLGLTKRVRIEAMAVERVQSFEAAVISARAFAPLDKLLTLGQRFSHSGTVWVLPKGRNAESELAQTSKAWQGMFHVKQSVTDPESSIIVASHVRRGRA